MSKEPDDHRPHELDQPGPAIRAAEFADWDEAAQALAHMPWDHARRFFRSLGRHCKVGGHDLQQLIAAIEVELTTGWADETPDPLLDP